MNAPNSKREHQFSPPNSNNKRGKPPSYSPPSTKHDEVPTSNRYEILFPNSVDGSQPLNTVTDPKVTVEVHHTMDSPLQGDKLHGVMKKTLKPNISRPYLKKSQGNDNKLKNLNLRTAYKESSRK